MNPIVKRPEDRAYHDGWRLREFNLIGKEPILYQYGFIFTEDFTGYNPAWDIVLVE